MGKQARLRAARSSALARTAGEIPAVAGRQPCPCGSGLRYKDCHGRVATRTRPVGRPFEGLASEGDWIALREFVPAATAALTLIGNHAAESATVCTVLPGAYPALRRADGSVLVAMQTQSSADDPSREAARALVTAHAAQPGTPVDAVPDDAPDVRLQDIVDPAVPLEVVVHDGFDFWVDHDAADAGDVADALERANAAVVPTRRLTSVESAYWGAVRDRNQLRWVLPHPEREAVDALARLHAAGESNLGDGTRFVGSFRAHGLLVPVWDLPQDRDADALEEPAAAFAKRLRSALAVRESLSAAERRARDGLLNRQLTVR